MKKCSARNGIILLLWKSLISGFIESGCILLFASAVSLLKYVDWIESYAEKSGLTQICSWKRRSVFIAFSDCCGCSLILHQNSTNGNLLKISCNVVSETLSICKCWDSVKLMVMDTSFLKF